MARFQSRKGRVLFVAAVFALFATAAQADPRSKWRVEFDHWADNEGEMTLRIAPLDGTPIDVVTKIPAKTTENQAADLVKGSLKASLGKAYKVEVDDGEDVIVKRTGKTPKFELTLLNNTVSGLSVNIKRE
jgi:hypothetical protein